MTKLHSLLQIFDLLVELNSASNLYFALQVRTKVTRVLSPVSGDLEL